jgi:hypothetical protein
VGWISFFDERGRPWTPIGGFGGKDGWDGDPSWGAQCGAGVLYEPLGIAVGPRGRLYVVDKSGVDGVPSIAMFDIIPSTDGGATCNHVGSIPLVGLRLPNDVAVGPDGSLYVTDSAFGAPAQSAIYRITDPDGDPRVEKWVDLASHPAPNPIDVAVIDSGNGPRTYLFVATLGSKLDPKATEGLNGEVLRIEITTGGAPGPVDVLGDHRGLFDGIAVQHTPSGARLLVGDLRTRRIESMDPVTGDHELWSDLSALTPQIGGIGCNDDPNNTTCAQVEYRGSAVFVLSPESAEERKRRESTAAATCETQGTSEPSPGLMPPGSTPPTPGGPVIPPITTPGNGTPGGDHK